MTLAHCSTSRTGPQRPSRAERVTWTRATKRARCRMTDTSLPNRVQMTDSDWTREAAMTSPASDGTLSGGRRRIDKVLADDFAVDLEGLDISDLRERRREAEQEEADLSYVRRML